MSKKNQSPLSVSNGIPLNVLTASRLTPEGAEICNPISRTVAAYLPTMGERIRRYLKSPTLQRDLYNDPTLWDPEDAERVFNEDGIQISRHEDRFKDGLKKAKERKSERDKEEKVKAEEAEKLRKENFRKEILSAIAEGENPLPKG